MEIIRDCPENVKIFLSYLKCEQILCAARKIQYRANPKSVEEAVLAISEPNPFTNILKGIVRFEDQLAIVFFSSALLQILSGSTIILIGATFRVVPSIFKGVNYKISPLCIVILSFLCFMFL
nr:uncharacterized protein LOC124814546 [Hydra vulgaris]